MKKNIKDALCVVVLIVVTTAIFIGVAYHIWSDCLEENSRLTCNRILTKP